MVKREDEIDKAEELLSKISGGNILDVATGSGGFITFLLDNLQSFEDIIGIDSSVRSLQLAANTFPRGNIHFQLMDATALDFPEDHFDMVCISNSLHHLDNLSGVLVEMKRVCKPDGYFMVSEMFCDHQSATQHTHVRLHHWRADIDTAEGITHHATYTRREVIEIINTIGLRNLKFFNMRDLEANPKDPELLIKLDDIIDCYLQRINVLTGHTELQLRGEQLKQRLHQIGFHAATTLLALGRK
jgi:SAM-dependent methyltransferase